MNQFSIIFNKQWVQRLLWMFKLNQIGWLLGENEKQVGVEKVLNPHRSS